MSNHYICCRKRPKPISQGELAGCRTPIRGESIPDIGCGAISSEGAIRRSLSNPGTAFGRCSTTFTLIRCGPDSSTIVTGWKPLAGGLAAYMDGPASGRSGWRRHGIWVAGCKDNASGRRSFLGFLEKRVDGGRRRRLACRFPEGTGKPDLAIHSALRRGWLFGSQVSARECLAFEERRLGRETREDGYRGAKK